MNEFEEIYWEGLGWGVFKRGHFFSPFFSGEERIEFEFGVEVEGFVKRVDEI